MERITGADWLGWFYYLSYAAIQGVATSVRSALSVGAASAASTEQWQQSLVDIKLLMFTAVFGFALSVTEFLKNTPLPSGKESEDAPPKTTV